MRNNNGDGWWLTISSVRERKEGRFYTIEQSNKRDYRNPIMFSEGLRIVCDLDGNRSVLWAAEFQVKDLT